ncbi:MAG TPA: hypothetical protein VFW63_03380 [Acidimicrobiales bacterium]|nr:hypothetical protein [Acidimicrobiales bacterium]
MSSWGPGVPNPDRRCPCTSAGPASFYGDRTYRAREHGGHIWTFVAHVRDVSRAEAEAAIGRSITAPGWS